MKNPTFFCSPGLRLRFGALFALVAALGGCASFSPDGGFGPIEQTARERLGASATWPRSDGERGVPAA